MASPLVYFLYVVCSMDGKGPALHIFRMNAESGALTPVDTPETPLRTGLFCETDASGKFLYVADFVPDVDGVPGGAVAAFSIDSGTGKVKFLNRASCGGTVPCYASISPDRTYLLAANYGDGSVTMMPIKEDGTVVPPCDRHSHLGPNDKQANAHSIIFDPRGAFALSADLGVNKIFTYKPGENGLKIGEPISIVNTKPGAGPRHLAFHPNGKFVYCQTEYDNTVIVMSYNVETGAAKIIQTESSLPAGFTAKTYGADILVHPSGKFLYSTNRGHDSIAIFSVDSETGKIAPIGHEPTQGKFPRDFTIDPMGKFLLVGNEKSDTIITFKIDEATGKLAAVGQPIAITKPSCLKLVAVSE